MACSDKFQLLLQIKKSRIKMGKKKNKHTDRTFFDVVGLKNILHNDIVNFIIGVALVFLSIYMIIAFLSFFSTGQYDQSLILDHSLHEVLNKDREFKNSCGSFGAFVSYFFIARSFGISAFIIPVFMGLAGLKLVKAYNINLLKWFVCLMIAMIWLSIAAAKLLTPVMGGRIFNPGGDHGLYCSQFIENVIGVYGLTAVLLLSAIIFLTYLSKETINVVRNILNPVGKLSGNVKFGIKNNVSDKSGKQQVEPIKTLDDPEVFDDPETQTVVFDDAADADQGRVVGDGLAELDLDVESDRQLVRFETPDHPADELVEHASDHAAVRSAGVALVFAAVRKQRDDGVVLHLIKRRFDPKRVVHAADDAAFAVRLFAQNFHKNLRRICAALSQTFYHLLGKK